MIIIAPATSSSLRNDYILIYQGSAVRVLYPVIHLVNKIYLTLKKVYDFDMTPVWVKSIMVFGVGNI